MPSWKIVRSKKQNARKTKWALTALAIIIGIIFLGKAVKFTQTIFSPWSQSQNIKKSFYWQGDFNINIIIKAKNVSLLIFSPKDQRITIVDIPDNTITEAALGFGKWQIGSLYDLGQSQKEIGGRKLLTKTLTSLFALPIDGFLDFSAKFYSKKEASEIVSELRKNPFSALSILPFLKTDLTPWELFKLKMGLSDVRFDKIKQVNLENWGVLRKEKLADGSQVLEVDIVRLDSYLSDLIDPKIRMEHKSIAIFNATSRSLLAQKAARLVNNLGGNVIITANSQDKFKTTQVVGENSETLDRLKQIFGRDVTIDPNSEDLVSSRAQINIFLGEDF